MELSIGALAGRAGVTTRTIRYYEEVGILPPPPRSGGGVRRYSTEYLLYIDGALMLKEMGFGLADISLISRLARGERLTKAQRAAAERAVASLTVELERRLRVLQFVRYAILSRGDPEKAGLPPAEEFARTLGIEPR